MTSYRLCLLLLLLAAIASGFAVARQSSPRLRPNVAYATRGGSELRLDAYIPRTKGPLAGIVVIHGGGWTAGSKASVDAFANKLAGLGFDAFAIDYRLAPQHRFPAAVQDLEGAVAWLKANARRFNLDPRRVGLLGFSAGGNIALDAAFASPGAIQAVAGWSAPTDLSRFLAESGSRYALRSIRAYIGCAPSDCAIRYLAASPVRHVARDTAAVFLANSTHELVPLAQARELVSRLRAAHRSASVFIVPGTGHATAYAKVAWPPTVQFFRRTLGR